MERRIARYMRNEPDGHKYNTHHILGDCNHSLYNVDMAENLIRVLKSKHVGYNNFVGSEPENQTPRGLFVAAHEWTHPVLSDYAETLLRTLCEMDDDQLYKKELLKNKKKPG